MCDNLWSSQMTEEEMTEDNRLFHQRYQHRDRWELISSRILQDLVYRLEEYAHLCYSLNTPIVNVLLVRERDVVNKIGHPEISEEAHLPSQVDGEDLQGITAGLQDWLSFGNIHWTALS
ncbi:hypothetical protein MJO28_007356 [Puccinia striiformis f. sp. tritici]|uniref:Uncharacterized protein n=1 Tax=Puccinia striiformis f. sp. tritici TaxID=168172 RepID=A0ACC0EH55_9BASI|nr:hypothetical protein MJO28_007356 [Puccinia striiformis f. sp. tritici]